MSAHDKPLGRPPLNPEDKRTERVGVRFTRAELRTLDERRGGTTRARYLRERGLLPAPAEHPQPDPLDGGPIDPRLIDAC